jgi:hypothetical protein
VFKDDMLKLPLFLFALLLPTSVFAEMCSDLSGFDKHAEGNPVLKINPKYPSSLSKDMPSGCAIVEYKLAKKTGSSGNTLMPVQIVIIEASQRAFGDELENAVENWLFFTKAHPN